jgi:hypothetical protein
MSDKTLTPEFRVSYANVFKPQKNDLNGKMEYSLVAIFPKGTDLTALKAAAAKPLIEKYGPDQAKWPSGLRSPFRKCSERWKNEGGKQVIPAGYEDGDAIFLTLKATEAYRPGVVDASVQDIVEPRDFYSGCYARASVRAYFYEQKGNRGVSFGLNNVQKLRDGDSLGGGASKPTDDFQPVDAPAAAAAGGQGAKSIFD